MPKPETLYAAARAKELYESEAFKSIVLERKEELKGLWVLEQDAVQRERLWQEMQSLLDFENRLEAAIQAPIIEEQMEKRLSFDKRIK